MSGDKTLWRLFFIEHVSLLYDSGRKQGRYQVSNFFCSRGRVAQSVERPSKGPSLVQLYRMGSNPGRGIGVINNCR